MRKYLFIIKLTLEEQLTYRLNFLLWRFRNFAFLFSLFFFWLAVYGNKEEFLGYQKAQMIAYVIGIAFLRSIVFSSRSGDLPGQIRSGELTRILLRPIKATFFWFAGDLADKLLNIIFTILEVGLLLKLFNFPFYFPQRAESYFYFLLLSFLAVFLYFFLSFFISATSFWSEEIWATRWLFGIVFLEFFAGAFFPIDVLPAWLAKIIYLTPFPYLVFFPLKIWLEQLSLAMILRATFICFGWLVIFWWLSLVLWKKGVKNYGAYGG